MWGVINYVPFTVNQKFTNLVDKGSDDESV